MREVSVGTRNIAVSSFFCCLFSFVFADFQLTAACTAPQTSDFGETCIPLRSQLYARRGAKAAIATAPKCTFPVSRHHMIWVDYASVVPWRAERTVNSVPFIETDLFPAEGRRDASRWTERLFWWAGNLRPLNVSTSPGCSGKTLRWGQTKAVAVSCQWGKWFKQSCNSGCYCQRCWKKERQC